MKNQKGSNNLKNRATPKKLHILNSHLQKQSITNSTKKMESIKEAQAFNNGRNQSNSIFPILTFPSSRRTHSLSFSSFSSSSSSAASSSSSSSSSTTRSSSPPPSPASRIPFSWETFPGIPKTNNHNHNLNLKHNQNQNQLPLPPGPNFNKINNHSKPSQSLTDPFFAALVECSKGGDHGGAARVRVRPGPGPSRRLSGRFGFVNNLSCKSSSAIAESLVFLPRGPGPGSGPRRISYDVVKKRPGG